MRLLVISQYFYPESFQINDICRELARQGHSVTVLTGLPNYPGGTVPEEYRCGRRREEMWEGVRVIRCFEIGRRCGILWLGLNYLSYCLSAAWKSRKLKNEFDVIYVYQLSPVLMAFPGAVLKKRLKKPLYLYCCDIWPESMRIVLHDQYGPLIWAAKKASTALYRACDRIAVQSPAFLDYFQTTHGIPSERLCYIPQYAEGRYMGDESIDNGIFDFVFLGNIGMAQGIDIMLSAAEILGSSYQFVLHFVGDGSFLENAKELTRKKGLSGCVKFYGRRPPEEMPEFYRLADACLLALNTGSLVDRTIPSKLQGYMAAGCMVIGAIDGPAETVIEEAQCGLCAKPGDASDLARKMAAFMQSPEKYQGCGRNGRAYFEKHFSKEQYLKKTCRILNELCEGSICLPERH